MAMKSGPLPSRGSSEPQAGMFCMVFVQQIPIIRCIVMR